MTHPSPTDAALQIAQQAITILAKWADAKLPPECICLPDYPVVERVKRDILPWPSADPQALGVLFDEVKLDQGQTREHYWHWPAIEIADTNPTINYPQEQEPNLEKLQGEVKNALKTISGGDWQNLSLLTLIIEKFGSYISFGEDDVAFVDLVRSTGAIAAALASDPNFTIDSESPKLSLIAGDLSGIQKFIYTISSDGALKSLRARSFYLELVIEEVVQQLLIKLNLPRTNVIYAGGGNLYLLAAATDETKLAVEKVREQLNQWLLKEFQGKVSLALTCFPSESEEENFVAIDVANQKFAQHWECVTRKLAKQKYRKFADQIAEFIEPRESHTPCKVCHRDDVKESGLQMLNQDSLVLACETCCRMFDLGGKLFGVKAIVRSQNEKLAENVPTLSFKLPATQQLPASNVYYHLFTTWEPIVQNSDTVLLVNDWTIEHYQFRHFREPVLLLLGNYGKLSNVESGFIRAGEMAEVAKGIKRVGYLRMDVDRLGQIFAKGLGEKQTLPRLAGLSRQMSYFFTVYLKSLAKNRSQHNLPDNAKKLTNDARQHLLFIYAGGDDLFVSGAWNEVVEFAFDVYQSFRAYTGKNPDITLSAGISIAAAKFPLYQAADESGEAEKAAKGNGRDSLGLFGGKFKWDEWLGIEDITVIDDEIMDYLKPESRPDLWGIFPLVEQLNKRLDINYSRSFIRNLLLTAELQEQMLKKFKEKSEEEQREIRYYLHLPKIAYTLARLPSHVRDHKDFAPVRTSLKNPYNAPYFRAVATWIELLNRS